MDPRPLPVDSAGARVPLMGKREGADRVLCHELGGARSTWQPQGPDRVRFFQERQVGAGWAVAFDSTYVRR